MKKLLVIFLSLFYITQAQAIEEIKVCGKYQRADYSWSHWYKLTGYKLDGDELEDLLNNRRSFYSLDNYFLIPWKNGGYTYYKVDSYFPSSFGKKVKDQNGRRWEFKEGWNYCY